MNTWLAVAILTAVALAHGWLAYEVVMASQRFGRMNAWTSFLAATALIAAASDPARLVLEFVLRGPR